MIRIEGIEEYPRYKDNHIIGKLHQYFGNSFYRFVIMSSIKNPYKKFRNPINIVDNAIDEAYIIEDTIPNEEELLNFRELVLSFVSCEEYMRKYRGKLFEQIIRSKGHKELKEDYHPKSHSLEEAKIYCEKRSYNNGESEKKC